MLDNVGVGRVQWGIPKGYPHPPLPPRGGGGARVVPDALLYNNEKPRCKNSGVIVLLLFTYPL
jgi:hypothetical protein